MGNDDKRLRKYQQWYDSHIAKGTDSFEKFHYHLQYQTRRLTLNGKRVLEVGCGRGAVSLYLALFSGAREVVALDEAAGVGAPVGVTDTLKDALQEFRVRNSTVVNADIMRNDFPDESFDVVIANYALHHVVDSGFIAKDPATRQAYHALWTELARVVVPGGTLSVAEISRICFWRWSPVKLKLKNIDWELHPTRGEWLSSMSNAGIVVRGCDFLVPYGVRKFESLFANSLAGFFSGSNFILTAEKVGSAKTLVASR